MKTLVPDSTSGSGFANTTLAAVIDVGQAVDRSQWSRFHTTLLILVGCAVVLDGFNIQVLGFAIPALMKDWALNRASFSGPLASGLVGMTVGTAVAGIVGDRFGRKTALIGSILFFGVFTMLMALATAPAGLTWLRLAAGLALGGALPNAATLLAESTPVARRSVTVTTGIVCIPLGGVLGGLFAGPVLPWLGWKALFVAGGLAPILVGLLLMAAMTESPRWLVQRPERRQSLRRVLSRMELGFDDDATYVDGAEGPGERASPTKVLKQPFTRDTIALWIAFFACLLSVYACFNWLPAMLAGAGYSLKVSGNGLLAFNMGGVVTALLGAFLIQRVGSRISIAAMACGGLLCAIWLAFVPLNAALPIQVVILALALEGGFINGVQTTMFALAAHIYPTEVRSTGIGIALGVGRIGSVLSSYLGAFMLSLGGSRSFFILIMVGMFVNMIALLCIRNHIPKTVFTMPMPT